MIGAYLLGLIAGIGLGVGIAGIWWRKRKGKVRHVAYTPLPQKELENSLAMMPEQYLVAFFQKANEIQVNAAEAASNSVGNHGISASCIGGFEHIQRLKDEISIIREAGQKKIREESKD